MNGEAAQEVTTPFRVQTHRTLPEVFFEKKQSKLFIAVRVVKFTNNFSLTIDADQK
jgi:hypothetical protein